MLATVCRRGRGEEWRASGRRIPDGTGVITWIDRDVVPSSSYDYRLGVESPGGERFYGETRIGVPARSTLSLEGMQPNPGDGRMLVAFSLANRAPAPSGTSTARCCNLCSAPVVLATCDSMRP